MGGQAGRFRVPLTIYGVLTLLLVVQQHISNAVLRQSNYRGWPWQGWNFYLAGLSQFDGNDYTSIASHGYRYTPGEMSQVVWFPLYPLTIRALRPLTDDALVAGVLVTILAGAAAMVLFWRWLGDHTLDDHTLDDNTLNNHGLAGAVRLTAFACLALYPYSWFLYGVVYADALQLLLLVGAFLLADRRRLVLAGLVGALATATRPVAICLVPALILLGLERDGVISVPVGASGLRARFALPTRFDRRRLRPVHLAPALAVTGLIAYMVYLWHRFDDPWIWLSNEKYYRPDSWPILHKGFFSAWLHFGHDPRYALTTLGQALCLLAVVLTIPACCRRYGFAYGAYVAMVAALPTLSTGDFMGTGRYLIAAFPAFGVFGEWLAARPRLRTPALAGSGLVMAFLAFHFSRSAYLS